MVLTIIEKLEACKTAKRGRNLSSLATEYAIGKATESTISIAEVLGKLKDFQTDLHDGDCVKKRRIVRRADFQGNVSVFCAP